LGQLTDYDTQTLDEFSSVKSELEKLLDNFKFRDALKEAMNLARIGNKYLADTEPWKVAKTDMDRVATIMHLSLQIAANLAIAFEPFLPFTASKLRGMLGMKTFNWSDLGKLNLLEAGSVLGTAELLFDKIEDETVVLQVQKLLDTKKANEAENHKANQIKDAVAFEDFQKMDIRVGTVLDCQKVPKADKLLQFRIADGLQDRTILSGIAQHYPNPEELIGTQVCFIANFEARKLRGIMSEGMILSVEDADGKLVLIQPKDSVSNGSQVG
jgi:methionyl-tRNA synthetase